MTSIWEDVNLRHSVFVSTQCSGCGSDEGFDVVTACFIIVQKIIEKMIVGILSSAYFFRYYLIHLQLQC